MLKHERKRHPEIGPENHSDCRKFIERTSPLLKDKKEITTVAVLTATMYHERGRKRKRKRKWQGVIISNDLSWQKHQWWPFVESKVLNDCVGKYHHKKAKKEIKSKFDHPMMKNVECLRGRERGSLDQMNLSWQNHHDDLFKSPRSSKFERSGVNDNFLCRGGGGGRKKKKKKEKEKEKEIRTKKRIHKLQSDEKVQVKIVHSTTNTIWQTNKTHSQYPTEEKNHSK